MVEIEVEKRAIDEAQACKVGKLDPFVDLVHRLSDKAKLGNRALFEAPSSSAEQLDYLYISVS